MIKFYAYYSFGGYKDLYLGNNEDAVVSRYYLPLLPVYENDESMAEKVKGWRELPPIINLAESTTDNYPKRARVMMSHAGYKIQLRHIDGKSVFAIRDVEGAKDTYGRSCPFSMMLVADTDNEYILLRKIASYFYGNMKDGNMKELEAYLCTLFVYDCTVNGLRFDLHRFNDELSRIDIKQKDNIDENSYNRDVDFFVVPNNINVTDAFTEQGLTRNDVAYAYDVSHTLLHRYSPPIAQPYMYGSMTYPNYESSVIRNEVKTDTSSKREERLLVEIKRLYQEISDQQSKLDAMIKTLKGLIKDLEKIIQDK